MSSEKEYEQAIATACSQIEKNIVVIKPYLINILRYGKKNLTEKDVNEIIKRMVSEGIIDEYLALSKYKKPYAFYGSTTGKISFDKVIANVRSALIQNKKLTIPEASQITDTPLLIPEFC